MTTWLPVFQSALGAVLGGTIVALIVGGLYLFFEGNPNDAGLARNMFLAGIAGLGALIWFVASH